MFAPRSQRDVEYVRGDLDALGREAELVVPRLVGEVMELAVVDVGADHDEHDGAEEGEDEGEDDEAFLQAGPAVPVGGASDVVADRRVDEADVAAAGGGASAPDPAGGGREVAHRVVDEELVARDLVVLALVLGGAEDHDGGLGSPPQGICLQFAL